VAGVNKGVVLIGHAAGCVVVAVCWAERKIYCTSYLVKIFRFNPHGFRCLFLHPLLPSSKLVVGEAKTKALANEQ